MVRSKIGLACEGQANLYVCTNLIYNTMNTFFIMPLAIQGWEWIIIALVILLLFGGKKIPELMKGLGKGVKSFKQGMKEVEADVNEIKKDIESDETSEK